MWAGRGGRRHRLLDNTSPTRRRPPPRLQHRTLVSSAFTFHTPPHTHHHRHHRHHARRAGSCCQAWGRRRRVAALVGGDAAPQAVVVESPPLGERGAAAVAHVRPFARVVPLVLTQVVPSLVAPAAHVTHEPPLPATPRRPTLAATNSTHPQPALTHLRPPTRRDPPTTLQQTRGGTLLLRLAPLAPTHRGPLMTGSPQGGGGKGRSQLVPTTASYPTLPLRLIPRLCFPPSLYTPLNYLQTKQY